MTPTEFLQRIWPAEGYYVLATPWRTPAGEATYRHKVCGTVAEAVAFVEAQKHRTDIFFGVHALREPRVWNPSKPDPRTGEMGAFEVRTQRNALAGKCFHLDLDVGPSQPGRAPKYATQAEALAGLIAFCKAARLPKPLVTSSGGGLHVYWLIAEPLDSAVWKHHAAKLHHLTKHHALLADPARTRDSASVLRVAGTFNRKDPSHPRQVQVLVAGPTTPTTALVKLLDDAVVRAGLDVPAPIAFPEDSSGLGSNLEEHFDGPPVSLKALAAACTQVQRLIRARGDVSEPEWYHGLNLIRFVERGHELAHKFSAGHPGYDRDATDRKLAQLEQKGIKPTSCAKLAEVCGEDHCGGCPFAGRVKGPLMAARFKDDAPAPVVAVQLGDVTHTTEVPPPPKPFTRLKGGGISVLAKNRDGDEMHQLIYEHDLYPVRRLVNGIAGTEQQVWQVVLPREGTKEFTLDADALYDRRKFLTALANTGVYPANGNIPHLQDYMIAYIAELQKLTDSEAQCNHLGWTDERRGFVLPDKILQDDGGARPTTLSLGAQRATQHVHKRGTLQRQVELLRFFNHPAYVANQFYILGGLAAPLFFATGHHGVIVNASGEAGASKSTSLYTAASFWASPELYPINGTNAGATTKARNERVSTLANLPVCVDEITHMPVREAVDLAMSITQPGHRLRLNESGVERSSSGAEKATIMLSTANNSLHGLLSLDNAAGTAGSMRVFEIVFRAAKIHQKHEADDYLHELKQNYGHIGEQFMAFVIRHRDRVAARVRALTKEIDQAAGIQSSERFWSAAIATVLTAGEIAKALGLLAFDPKALKKWVLEVQIPHMRGVVEQEYSSPIGLLTDYLETINGNILVVDRVRNASNTTAYVKRPVHGAVLAHYDTDSQMMWVLKQGFKQHCQRTGANYLKVLDDLFAPRPDGEGGLSRIITSKLTRKVLGAGTDYAKAQSWCFAISMSHPDVAGAVSTEPATPEERRALLRAV